MQLRPYQVEAVDACAHALKSNDSALIVASTGSGKSLILASIAQRILERNCKWRVLVLCYVQEILLSNHEACAHFKLDSGVYCAGAGLRATTNSVIHASRDSLGARPLVCGKFDVIIVDECHMLSTDADSRYQKIIEALDPKYLIGLTATPYRLQGGMIYGKRKMFFKVAYEIGMEQLIAQGFLVPFVFPKVEKLVNTSGIAIKNGEFDNASIEKLVSNDTVILKSLSIWFEHAGKRQCTLFFCHSVEHAQRCLAHFKQRYPHLKAGYLDGKSNKKDRETLIAEMRAGNIHATFQCMTMTTGTNIPVIDCIVWLRPTASAVLFVQGTGRASRLYPGKKDALVIDVVGNMERFGSLYKPNIPQMSGKKKVQFTDAELLAMGIDPKEMKGEALTKECPSCFATVHAAAKKCDSCGKLFIILQDVFAGQELYDEYIVHKAGITQSLTNDRQPCVVITYWTNKGVFKEWILYEKPWEKERYWNRKNFLKRGDITHLRVQRNPKNPNFPKLTPLSQSSKD
jgi:DNA repair protein RadD